MLTGVTRVTVNRNDVSYVFFYVKVLRIFFEGAVLRVEENANGLKR